MSSTRKGSRITAYSSLMIIYAVFMIRKAFHFRPSITVFPQYTDEVRILSTTIPHSNAKGTVINDEEEATNFISIFENVLLENVPINSSNSGAKFSALLVKDGKVYCRRSQIKSLSRGKYFVQMLNEGLSLQYHRERAVANNDYHNTGSKKRKLRRRQEPKWQKLVGDDVDVSMLREMKTSNDFPILLKHDDSNGCNPSTRSDKYGFPRMTWSIPSKNAISSESLDDGLQNPWCAAIGVPPYKAWRELQKTNEEKSKEEKRWEATFIENELNYPWSFKRNQAVWRGSTTFNKALYGQLSFLEMPRAKLVEKSRDIPHLIDAGFHKFVGKYEGEKERLINETVFMDPIPLANMMKYKGERYLNMEICDMIHVFSSKTTHTLSFARFFYEIIIP